VNTSNEHIHPASSGESGGSREFQPGYEPTFLMSSLFARLPWGHAKPLQMPTARGLSHHRIGPAAAWLFTGGPVLFVSDADIDFDGPSPTATSRELKASDPYWLKNTSLRWAVRWLSADGVSVNDCDSRTFMGFVLPPSFSALGCRIGDYGLVGCGDMVIPAQFYDQGPRGKIGEISYGLAAALDIPNHPRRGNDVQDLVTLVFPGSGDGRAHQPEQQAAECKLRLDKLMEEGNANA
jgi:hypothetical protein